MYDLQFGFGQKHSTNHVLLNMTQQTKDIFDKGHLAVGVFVDFQKAFAVVNHKILSRKLEHYGIRGIVNTWFSSYLSNRQQYVSIGDVKSDIKQSVHSVPHGSLLGPLLVLLCMNDLNKCIHLVYYKTFCRQHKLIIYH